MTSTIVCGVEDSRHGRVPAALGAALATRLRGRLVLVHVLRAPTSPLAGGAAGEAPVDLGELQDLQRERAATLLDELADGLGPAVRGRRLEVGFPPERLAAALAEEGAALAVIGSRGEGALRAAALGSVSVALVRDAPCPVVVVPPGVAGELRGETVVCGAQAGDIAPVAVAAGLARTLGLRLVLAHVLPGVDDAAADVPVTFGRRLETDERRAVGDLNRALRAAGGEPVGDRPTVVLRRGTVAHELAALSREQDAALIVVGTRGYGALRSGLLGSVSRALVRGAPRPVVVCPPDLAPSGIDDDPLPAGRAA